MKATSRKDLAAWLDGLMGRYSVIAPRLVDDELLYRPVASSTEIVFDFERTVLSPKTFLLPDSQVILEVEKQDRDVTLTEPGMDREQVLFAVRPCDAQGLRALDALLLDRPPADSYYAERREKTTLIGLAWLNHSIRSASWIPSPNRAEILSSTSRPIALDKFRRACMEMILPIRPSVIACLAITTRGSNRQMWPTIKKPSLCCAASTIRSQSSTRRAIGFSSNTS